MTLVGFNGAHPDREKLRQLYEEHARGLIAFACSFVRSFAIAEDVLHQVFERLLRGTIQLAEPSAPYLLLVAQSDCRIDFNSPTRRH